MNKKTHETDEDYILDVLEDEEERLMDKLIEILPEKTRYSFFRYLSVKDTINKIKCK
ncbi:hypothetical protein CLOBY_26920 [Clostridium saccharobutylicum]|uniref:hypothetical protein n=1 Tax=Clostridium saccharobutylicum TaxID=169679 RepID=UPI000983A60B|nr:hypothetical protein [Clostridium saccharobutylicum]AQS10547.1 hypothetical protein CLOBY_26920 [Clostridium saccharobutylicum]MBC2438428.1 hypothetical protein [Clostridium saccharobutylicum]NSB90855.1 hypothetical protein [Clostridium saccharobutylicum]NYC31501.1 hypothetical protein [Clostridium saccharobutylicum]OOM18440.1 hypothetical protein CLSAB_07370 [Clostridium saccharobutylicum]